MQVQRMSDVPHFPWWLDRKHRCEGVVVLNAYGSHSTEVLTPLDDGTVLFMWMLSGQVEDELVLLFAHMTDDSADLIYEAGAGSRVYALTSAELLDDPMMLVDPADGLGIRVAQVSLPRRTFELEFDEFVQDAIREARSGPASSPAVAAAAEELMAVAA